MGTGRVAEPERWAGLGVGGKMSCEGVARGREVLPRLRTFEFGADRVGDISA